jgi:hypothetical protein
VERRQVAGVEADHGANIAGGSTSRASGELNAPVDLDVAALSYDAATQAKSPKLSTDTARR